MQYLIFTHTLHEKNVRRFSVTRTERDLYRKVEDEVYTIVSHRIFQGKCEDLCLHDLYMYVENRWYSLHPEKFKDFVNVYRFLSHMKDYCDTQYSRFGGKPTCGYPERMKKYSEILPVNGGTLNAKIQDNLPKLSAGDCCKDYLCNLF
jgi:hypothetical protein